MWLRSRLEKPMPTVRPFISPIPKSRIRQAPDTMLTNVYVFKNGIAGSGPLKFQADVFENTPDDAGYTPLRRIIFVTWADEKNAKELKSAAEIQEQVKQNAVTLEKSGVVVNMPFIVWKGGKR
jgi:hypothetical protein